MGGVVDSGCGGGGDGGEASQGGIFCLVVLQ